MILFYLPSFNSGNDEMNCDCDRFFMVLRELPLLLPSANYFSEKCPKVRC